MGETAVMVGARVRRMRLKSGLTQQQLGDPYFSRGFISSVELGKVTPTLKSLVHFAKKLGVRTRELIPDQL